MASSTFLRLETYAMQREYVIINEVKRLWEAEVATTFPQAVRIVRLLQQANSDFLDGIEQVVFRHQMRLQGPLRGCPYCDDPNCTGELDFVPDVLQQIFGTFPPKPPPAAS